MAYLPEERETVIRYDELDDCWYFESNVRRHVTKILKTEEAFESLEKELENDFCVYVRAKLTNLEDFSVNPFVKNKPKLSEEQKRQRAERLKSNIR
ncbi:chloramphenicol O-acetyltransferase [Streptococcus gallinaceus]|uniref:hypothetical protein n=1 Tax=Streptococcus gallinaceus TaxID=165758 RepID=UPI0020A05231|nr:hypothetical protein [Streptococcus gallinaceus]MCP1639668.1 chloramphenicol O-acetyltransferase [Streptococcus gallinaceus]MCP1770451.1 chloramphenicol O-acetyltransferase [Streptococcus gallinaceus]